MGKWERGELKEAFPNNNFDVRFHRYGGVPRMAVLTDASEGDDPGRWQRAIVRFGL